MRGLVSDDGLRAGLLVVVKRLLSHICMDL